MHIAQETFAQQNPLRRDIEMVVKVFTNLRKIICLKSCKNDKQPFHLHRLLPLSEKKGERPVHARC